MNTLQKSLTWMSRRTIPQLLLLSGMLAAGLILWDLYRNQLAVALPYLVLLLCPLMHIFLHRGHGHHGPGPGHATTESKPELPGKAGAGDEPDAGPGTTV